MLLLTLKLMYPVWVPFTWWTHPSSCPFYNLQAPHTQDAQCSGAICPLTLHQPWNSLRIQHPSELPPSPESTCAHLWPSSPCPLTRLCQSVTEHCQFFLLNSPGGQMKELWSQASWLQTSFSLWERFSRFSLWTWISSSSNRKMVPMLYWWARWWRRKS